MADLTAFTTDELQLELKRRAIANGLCSIHIESRAYDEPSLRVFLNGMQLVFEHTYLTFHPTADDLETLALMVEHAQKALP